MARTEEQFDPQLAENVKKAMRKARLDLDQTQAEFATRFGVDQGTISRWEQTGQIGTIKNLLVLAKAAKKTLDEILFGEASPFGALARVMAGELPAPPFTAKGVQAPASRVDAALQKLSDRADNEPPPRPRPRERRKKVPRENAKPTKTKAK